MLKIIIIFNFFIFLLFSKNVLSLDSKYNLKILKLSLSSPWSLTFINNNQILISEKTGKIKLFDIISNKITEIDHNLNVIRDKNSQGGLLDIYFYNNQIFISYSEKIGDKLFSPSSTSIAKADFDKNFDAKLVIGDNNVFHQYVTVSKGAQHASGITTIGSGNLFMAHSHAGHDCVIGDHTIMVNHATLAGHVTVDNYAIIGAFCAIHQFCRVGESALMTGGAMVNKDVVPFMVYARNPCKSYGVNKEGLKRRGYSTQSIANIHSAYKLIFKKRCLSKELSCALASISETCKEIEKIIHFIGQSERGVVR